MNARATAATPAAAGIEPAASHLRFAAAAVLLALLLAGCVSAGPPAGDGAPRADVQADAALAVAVKAALLEAADVAATPISVSAADGRVTLEGFVATDEERRRAIQIARGVEGVDTVRDALAIP